MIIEIIKWILIVIFVITNTIITCTILISAKETKNLKDIGSTLFWYPVLNVKLILIILGLFIVPFTKSSNKIYGNNEDPTPRSFYLPGKPEWLRDYGWRAIRNPVNNIRYFFEEPPPSVIRGDANPDIAVRSQRKRKSWRFTRSGWRSEYWYMKWRGSDKYFELRVGWKFSRVPGFAPTIQLGPRNR